ncbi:type II toxin-antitoxin system VapC family toxin [Microbacterium koreense]|uniref:Ribonuclease VapC n=1 Tax=Microbacterium koreense TaxID=323761 RepID=A0ABW2ZQK7_9MICO
MIVLDASIVIALLDADDTHHSVASALLLEHLSEPLAITALTLTEVLVHPAKTGVAETINAHVRALGVTVLPVGAEDALTLARTRAETRLRMPDAVVVHAAEAAGAALATADVGLARAARERGIVVHEA